MLPVPCIVRRIWTVFLIFHLQIFCVRGDCGPPPVVEHTESVTVTSGVAGDTFIYVCDHSKGYYELPDKSRTITCQDDDTWTSVSEFCARACGVPESLTYAVPKDSDLKDIYLPGTKVSFDCRRGYSRVPSSTNFITCLDNYTWSIPSEFCKRRSCGNPGEAPNGDFEATNGFVFGSRVTYTCNPGHRILSRRDYRDCQADGTWSNEVPVCEVVLCPAPDRPVNGAFEPEKDEYTYQDAVNFHCNKDLHVIGSGSASCTSDGTWSASPPTCRAISCEDPGPIQNGKKISGFIGPYTLHSAVRYECDKNFVMKGSSSVTCNINSRWEPEIPKCLIVFCPAPERPVNGAYEPEKDKYTYQDAVKFHCNKDLQVIGSGSASCTSDGTWSASPPTCRAISCEDPGQIQNGKKISGFVGPYTLNSAVRYECDKNFVMKGSSSVTCNINSQWEPEIPKCLLVLCPAPKRPVNGAYEPEKDKYTYQEAVNFHCNKDLQVIGSGSASCTSDGTWSASPPTCRELPPVVDNKIGVIVGSIVGVLCVLIIACGLYLYLKKKKSGKPKSDTPDVHYVACNDA